jgi:hypothetical protein
MKFKVKPQPKEIIYTSPEPDVQQDCYDEIKAISETNEKRKHESQLFKDNTDANYFTVVTFNNRAQLDEFLLKAGIQTEDRQYINGLDLAKAIGIEIESPSRPAPGNFKVSSKLLELTQAILQ